MRALGANGFPVPRAVDVNRHAVLMEMVDAYPLTQVRELAHPKRVWLQIMAIMERLAQCGLVHCDFNEFNLLIDDAENVTLIDFPQMVSASHPNAEAFFDRDIDCLKRFFVRKYDFRPDDHCIPPLVFMDIKCSEEGTLDKELRASGFGQKEQAELETVLEEERLAILAEDPEEEEEARRAREEQAEGEGLSDEEEEEEGDEDEEEDGSEEEAGESGGEEERAASGDEAGEPRARAEEDEGDMEALRAEALARARSGTAAEKGGGAGPKPQRQQQAQRADADAGADAGAGAEGGSGGESDGGEDTQDTQSVAGQTNMSTLDPRERAIRERLKAERRRARSAPPRAQPCSAPCPGSVRSLRSLIRPAVGVHRPAQEAARQQAMLLRRPNHSKDRGGSRRGRGAGASASRAVTDAVWG